jgi:hypothetical protein
MVTDPVSNKMSSYCVPTNVRASVAIDCLIYDSVQKVNALERVRSGPVRFYCWVQKVGLVLHVKFSITVFKISPRFFFQYLLFLCEHQRLDKHYDSINQSTHQSTEQPTNQSINQSIDRSINQSINQSVSKNKSLNFST